MVSTEHHSPNLDQLTTPGEPMATVDDPLKIDQLDSPAARGLRLGGAVTALSAAFMAVGDSATLTLEAIKSEPILPTAELLGTSAGAAMILTLVAGPGAAWLDRHLAGHSRDKSV